MNIINTVLGLFREYHRECTAIGGAVIFLLFVLLRRKLAGGIIALIAAVFYRGRKDEKDSLKKALLRPLSIYMVVLGLFLSVYINLPKPAVLKSFKILSILIICWALVNYFSANLGRILKIDSSDTAVNTTAIKFITNILKIIIVAFGIVMVISELGYNISGLITGLGVGGLAVSLAAQDAVSNLISGFIIILEKPFKIGEYIQFDDLQGTVENLTMRSTVIRTLDDSLVTVPNAKLTQSAIVNISRMNKRLINLEYGLLYSTENEVLERVQKEIKETLTAQEDILPEPMRCVVRRMDDSSITLEIFCYTPVTNIHQYYEIVSRVNLLIKGIINTLDTDFAFPSSSIYIEKK